MSKLAITIILFLVCFISFSFSSLNDSQGNGTNYENWSVISVRPHTTRQLKYLNSLEGEEPGDQHKQAQVQVWRQGSLSRPFDILLSPKAKKRVLARLRSLRMKYDVVNRNIQPLIDAEQEIHSAGKVRLSGWFNRFLKIDEVTDYLQRLAQEYPDIVRVKAIGTSNEGRPIFVAKVSVRDGLKKPAIWIDGGIHAREWISTSTVLYMLNKLVTGYKSDPILRNYVTGAVWYFAPTLNPDGYAYTRTNRMWRKNRRPRDCQSRYCCNGVDLNRNFGFDFGGVGASSSSCSETYRGPSAFSEPESRAVKDFVLAHKSIDAFITLHSYSQMWFYPYGNKVHFYPPDKNQLASVALKGAAAIAAVRGTKYEVGSAADLLYASSGGSDDWAKGVAGIKYVYTLELVPSDNTAGNGFMVKPSEIVPTGEETWAGLRVVADEVMRRSRLKREVV